MFILRGNVSLFFYLKGFLTKNNSIGFHFESLQTMKYSITLYAWQVLFHVIDGKGVKFVLVHLLRLVQNVTNLRNVVGRRFYLESKS